MGRSWTQRAEVELRPSNTLAIAALVVASFYIGGVPGPLPIDSRIPLAVLVLAAACLAWLMASWRPVAASWLAVAGLALAAHGLYAPLGLHAVLPLVALPTGLAAILIGLWAGLATAAVQTALLLWAGPAAAGGPFALGCGVASLWGMLGLMAAAYRPVYGFADWSWAQFRCIQGLLEEARDRRAELKQALEDLAAANLQLARMNRLAGGLRTVAEEARRAKEEFVANVSHELRTPLNMIIGFSEMMLQAPQAYGDGIPHALLADLEVIRRNSQHIAALIDDVLDLSQVEAGQMALSRERVALSEIIEAAAEAVRPLYESRGLYLRLAVAPGLPLVLCDRTRIREVLLNLLSNAGRFAEAGGTEVRAWQEGGDLVVSVADTGPGIAANDLGRLFRPFQQVDGSLRRRHGGTGLGLSISKSFVELHGGRMSVESKEGAGTTFTFRLPIEPPLTADAAVGRWFSPFLQYDEHPRRPAAAAPRVRTRFVVLESGDSLQRLLRRYVDNVEVVRADTFGDAARELARVPAQALLVNGAAVDETLARILATSPLPYGTPAIICSVPGASQAADALGAAGYLVKPVTPAALLQALDHAAPGARRVLVVDDEPEALQLLRRILSSAGRGYRMLRASDGEQALQILRAQRPDALLVDLVMPKMDGFQLLAAKNEDPMLRDIPTVVISARDPGGQPILSNALAATRGGGISVSQLLECVGALTRILSPVTPGAGPVQPAESAG